MFNIDFCEKILILDRIRTARILRDEINIFQSLLLQIDASEMNIHITNYEYINLCNSLNKIIDIIHTLERSKFTLI